MVGRMRLNDILKTDPCPSTNVYVGRDRRNKKDNAKGARTHLSDDVLEGVALLALLLHQLRVDRAGLEALFWLVGWVGW